MLVKRIFVFLCFSILVMGCAGSAKKINDLNVGMSKSKVIEIMGEPSFTSGSKNVEILSYKLTSSSMFSDTYFVRIKDGKVDRFGQQGSFGTYY